MQACNLESSLYVRERERERESVRKVLFNYILELLQASIILYCVSAAEWSFCISELWKP